MLAIENREPAESDALPKELVTTLLGDGDTFSLDVSWIGSLPDVARNNTNTDCLHQARIWLKQCCEKHPLCFISQGKDEGQYPKRVIDVDELRLREFENIDTENKQYVTCKFHKVVRDYIS